MMTEEKLHKIMTKNNLTRIYEPDYSLKAKIGVEDLNQIFTKEVISKAQEAIENSSAIILNECLKMMIELQKAFIDLENNKTRTSIQEIIDLSFSIKSKTGQYGNILASNLAKSLQLHAEQMLENKPTNKAINIINWHINSLNLFLEKNIKGYGGKAGEALLREINNLQINKKCGF